MRAYPESLSMLLRIASLFSDNRKKTVRLSLYSFDDKSCSSTLSMSRLMQLSSALP